MSVEDTIGLGVNCGSCTTSGFRIVNIEISKPRTFGPLAAEVDKLLSDAPAAEILAVEGPTAVGPTVGKLVAVESETIAMAGSSGPLKGRYHKQAPATLYCISLEGFELPFAFPARKQLEFCRQLYLIVLQGPFVEVAGPRHIRCRDL